MVTHPSKMGYDSALAEGYIPSHWLDSDTMYQRTRFYNPNMGYDSA